MTAVTRTPTLMYVVYVLAALVLLVTAADAWLSALLGVRPLIATAYRTVRYLADECRAWAAGVVEAEIVESDRKVRL